MTHFSEKTLSEDTQTTLEVTVLAPQIFDQLMPFKEALGGFTGSQGSCQELGELYMWLMSPHHHGTP